MPQLTNIDRGPLHSWPELQFSPPLLLQNSALAASNARMLLHLIFSPFHLQVNAAEFKKRGVTMVSQNAQLLREIAELQQASVELRRQLQSTAGRVAELTMTRGGSRVNSVAATPKGSHVTATGEGHVYQQAESSRIPGKVAVRAAARV